MTRFFCCEPSRYTPLGLKTDTKVEVTVAEALICSEEQMTQPGRVQVARSRTLLDLARRQTN